MAACGSSPLCHRNSRVPAAHPPPRIGLLCSQQRVSTWGHFKTAEPQWTPLAATDMRAAWTGVYPGRADLPIRVEAAAFRGRAVYFQIVWPWTTPERVPAAGSAADLIAAFLLVAVTAAAVALARHNWKAGRGDLRGATRLALFNIPLLLLRWLLGAHHLGPGEGGLVVFFRGLELAVFVAASTWVTYH